jgi:acetyl esterase/lipase
MMLWLTIRFSLALLIALFALHVIVKFQTILAWYVTVGATELGHWLSLIALVIVVPGINHGGWLANAGTVLLLISAAVLAWPSIHGRKIGKRLSGELKRSLGVDVGGESPLTWRGMFLTKPAALKKPETLDYANGRKLHLFRAAAEAPVPCILLFHGGGWQSGGPLEFSDWSAHWASRGYAVAAVQYRFAPEHPWPAQREDVRLALDYLKQNAAKLGVDPTRFILLGRSAGGQVATAAAYGLRDAAIVGCVSIYGPADMFFARRFALEDDVVKSLQLLRNLLGGDPDQAEENYRSASGFLLADERSCPTLLVHGARDTIVWHLQSRRLAGKLGTLGVKHFLLELPWATHGFDWFYRGPGSTLTRSALDAFLESVTRR